MIESRDLWRFGIGAATTLLLSTTSLSAPLAQSNEAAVLDLITVTARRKEESLQSVPVAVTAIGANTLRDFGASDLGDIQNMVPGLTLHEGDAENAVVYIRGIGQIDSLAFADPGVGVYIDDVYLGRAQGSFLDVYDVERIEVLRGPQGTLYGRNTIGGAVKFVSRKPSEETELRLSGTFGRFDRTDVQASVSGPLSGDKVLGSASVAYLARDGYSDNAFDGEDDGDKETFAWRAGLTFNASEQFTIEISTDGSRDHPNTSRTPSRETAVFGAVPANEDPFMVDADFNDLNQLDVTGVSSHVTFGASDTITLKSITAYRQMDYDTHLDLDATPFPFFGVFVHQDQDQFSQELQLSYDAGGSFNFVAGAYYFRETDETESGIFGPAIAFVSNSLNDQTNRSYALYGQANFAVSDRLTATLGLRYTYEEKDFFRIQEFFDAATPLVPPLGQGFRVTDVDVSDDWNNFSPRFGLDYQATDNVMVYGNVSRGFKSGGFDGRSNSANEAVAFQPETVWSYEAGIKSTLWDGKALLNIAGYYNDYKNLQLSSFVADDMGAFSALFTNAGSAEMKGFEVEFQAKPTADLGLNASLSFLDGQYNEFIGPGGTDISGERELVNAPEWTFFIAPDYGMDVADLGRLTLRGDLAYRSKTYPTVSSSEILAQSGYALLGASATFEHASERWRLTFGGKNLTDKRYIQHGFDLSDSLGYQLGYFGAPRTWYLTLDLVY